VDEIRKRKTLKMSDDDKVSGANCPPWSDLRKLYHWEELEIEVEAHWKSVVKEIQLKWNKFNVDGDDKLTGKEVTQLWKFWMKSFLREEPGPEVSAKFGVSEKEFIEKVDHNGDGQVSWAEFSKFMRKMKTEKQGFHADMHVMNQLKKCVVDLLVGPKHFRVLDDPAFPEPRSKRYKNTDGTKKHWTEVEVVSFELVTGMPHLRERAQKAHLHRSKIQKNLKLSKLCSNYGAQRAALIKAICDQETKRSINPVRRFRLERKHEILTDAKMELAFTKCVEMFCESIPGET
jgi:hypothetical protein